MRLTSIIFAGAVAMGMTACSCTNGGANLSDTPEQASAPVTDEKLPVTMAEPSSAPEIDGKPTLSIYDELAANMVKVESSTGSFSICRYEVTQKLWKEVMGDNPSQMQGDDLPVEQVNWNDCQTFIGRLNELTGMSYRLPTEEEWEFACRGGELSKGYQYSGSDDIDAVAWYSDNSGDTTHPVGQKQPNELGLYDMSGNVWEWCQDMNDGEGMCRGGSWIHNARNCDPSLRNETPRAFSINSLGLRLAL